MGDYLKVITFEILDRQPVEVYVTGHERAPDGWYPGELRQWVQHHDGTWWGNVAWRHTSTALTNFPAYCIREDTVDRSRGRS